MNFRTLITPESRLQTRNIHYKLLNISDNQVGFRWEDIWKPQEGETGRVLPA